MNNSYPITNARLTVREFAREYVLGEREREAMLERLVLVVDTVRKYGTFNQTNKKHNVKVNNG